MGAALSSAPMIQAMDIPQTITDIIHSFLPCVCEETTLDLPRDESFWHSNPTIEYGTEALILLTPPRQTSLPCNYYTLDQIIIGLGTGNPDNPRFADCELFIGIQIFDKLKKPGQGKMI